MAKVTKQIIIRTLLNIAAENNKLTIEEISKRSGIPRSTIKKNFPDDINGIVEYIYIGIVREVNQTLLQYDVNDVSLELFSNIFLPILWKHREEAHIIYTSPLPFQLIDQISAETVEWAGDRFNKLVIEHDLAPNFSGIDLLKYFNAHLVAILTLWLGVRFPVDIEKFKPIFLYLMRTPMKDLIYKGIDSKQ